MIKIFDCSNSNERPQNRGNGGPIENDIMCYLKRYASIYDCIFVSDIESADIIITNDVFPTYTTYYNVPKIKRMDGVFFQEQYRERNESLNLAARQANHVIFISKFSQDAYNHLYGDGIRSSSVALNQVDPSIFYSNDCTSINHPIDFITAANNWGRPEKRFQNIIDFAELIDGYLYIIGSVANVSLPSNIVLLGYIHEPININKVIGTIDAFVNFSYKDAAPKTVLQGLCCGLPVLYANSGGLPELANGYGYGIFDNNEHKFENNIPLLSKSSIKIGYDNFIKNFSIYKKALTNRKNFDMFKNMLDEYFFQIRRLAHETR